MRHNLRREALGARRNKRKRRKNYRLWLENLYQKEEKPTIIILYER